MWNVQQATANFSILAQNSFEKTAQRELFWLALLEISTIKMHLWNKDAPLWFQTLFLLDVAFDYCLKGLKVHILHNNEKNARLPKLAYLDCLSYISYLWSCIHVKLNICFCFLRILDVFDVLMFISDDVVFNTEHRKNVCKIELYILNEK